MTSTDHNSNDYNEKYMKIKFNSDDDLPLKKLFIFLKQIL